MDEISCLKNKIEILTLKNALYLQIIKKYTNIKIEDLLLPNLDLSSVNELRIIINDTKPISVKDIKKVDEIFNKSPSSNIKEKHILNHTTHVPHKLLHTPPQPKIFKSKKKNKKIKYKKEIEDYNTEFIILDQPEEEFEGKKNYKSLKNFIDLQKESEKEFIKNNPDDIIEKEKMLKEYNDIIKEAHKLIIDSRVFTKTINIIKKTHQNIMNITTYNEYFSILNRDIKKIRKILQNKDYQEKKIESTIINTLSPIDLRILFNPNYIKNSL
jgi:hypothetical protein